MIIVKSQSKLPISRTKVVLVERKLHDRLDRAERLPSLSALVLHTAEVGDERTGRDDTLVKTHAATPRDRVYIHNVKFADILASTTACYLVGLGPGIAN